MIAGSIAPEQQSTIVGTGRKTVTAAGTPVQLGTTTMIAGVLIQALKANAGNVMIGGPAAANCDITNGSELGVELESGQSISLTVRQLSDVYIDSDTSGDGVSYILYG